MNYGTDQSIILPIYMGVYFLTLLFLFKVYHTEKEERKKRLAPLFIINLILFSAFVAGLTFWYDFSPDLTQFVIIYGLVTVGVYVVTIEVPGFIILSRFDEKSVQILQDVKNGLIGSRFKFDEGIKSIQNALVINKQRLLELHAYDQIEYYETSSTEMNQSNISIFDLLLISMNQWIKECEGQSKHPFPKVVDIFSLAGLSFLIAQLLK